MRSKRDAAIRSCAALGGARLGGPWWISEPDGERRVIGFIAELGGMYEVENLTGPRTREYCEPFKEAMSRNFTKKRWPALRITSEAAG